jgi:4-amino-4-deoxy-L-arabinose transferase-like glycosyltransferase
MALSRVQFAFARLLRVALAQPVAWLLALSIVHGVLYAAILPPWQAPDETAHYEYLRALAQSGELFPSQLTLSREVDRQVGESARRFRFWEYRRLPTPAETPQVVQEEIFLTRGLWSLYYRLSLPIYRAVSAWPVESQLYVLRLYSVTLQCVTVWLTYQLGRLIFPRPAGAAVALIPTAAAFVVAVFPQYTFISASYNDDNLVPPLVAATLYSLVRGLRQAGAWRWLALATITTVFAILTKRTALSLVLLWGLCLLVYAALWLRSASVARRALGAVVLLLALVASLGLPYLFARTPELRALVEARLSLSPDVWTTLAGYAREPVRLAAIDWRGPLVFLSMSFWGWFGWLKVPLGTHLMEILRRVTVVLVAGCGIGYVRAGLAARAARRLDLSLGSLLLLGMGMSLSFLTLVAQFLIGPPIYSLVGRYLFPFISAFGILAVWGWQAWWPARWKVGGVLLGLTLLVALDFAALALTIVPYFYS